MDECSIEIWIACFLDQLCLRLEHAEFNQIHVQPYQVSFTIRDGEMSKASDQLRVRYVDRASLEISEMILSDKYVHPEYRHHRVGCNVASATKNGIRATVVMEYDAKSAGTRVTFRV